MGRRAKPRNIWPETAAYAAAGVAVVVCVLVPLDLALRTWIVRGMLVALVLGVALRIVVAGRLTPTRANRLERLAFQTVFFWGFFTGITFAVPGSDGLAPLRAVVGGIVAAMLFGLGLLALDPWVVRRGGTGDRPPGDTA